MRRVPFALTAIAALFVTPVAMAADPVVVVSATRSAHDSFDLPASVDVINMERDGDNQLRVNVSEVLSRVPGLVAQNRQNYAQDLQISSRGFGARAAFGVRGVRLLVDGIPATLPDGQGQAATFNLDAADRIEVLRGPFSSVYGNHAGGLIQLFTRDGKQDPTAEVHATTAPDGARKIGTTLQGSIDSINYLVDASRFETDGYREHSAALREQGFAKLAFALPDSGKLTLQASVLHQPNSQDPLGVSWASFQRDPRAGEIDASDTNTPKRSLAERYNTRKDIDHQQLGLAWDQHWGDGQWHLVAYGGTRRVIQYQAFSRAVQAAPSHSGGVVDIDRGFSGIDANWTRMWPIEDGAFSLTVGLDAARTNDARLGFENFLGSQLGVKGALRRDEQDRHSNQAPYLQLEWKSGQWVTNAGVRRTHLDMKVEDHFLGNGDDSGQLAFAHTTPMLALLYKVNPLLNVYASAAAGFETPTMNEMFYSSSGGFNYKLAAARSIHQEIGFKAITSALQANAAFFQVDTKDELVVDAASGGRTSYRNASRTLRQGAELALDARFGERWSSHVAATLLRAVYTQGFGGVAAGSRLPGVPNASLFSELAWKARDGAWGAALEAQASGRVFADDANADVPAPGYAIANAVVHAQYAAGRWQFRQFARLNNLANRRYVSSVIVGDSNRRYYEAAPDRQLSVGVKALYRY